MKYLYLTVVWMTVASLHAKPYLPNDEAVLLKLDKQKVLAIKQARTVSSVSAAKRLARQFILKASEPGYSDQYLQAEQVLANHVHNRSDAELLYLWAQVLQHNHQFNEAQTQLRTILEQHPNHPPAHLMAARIALIQARPQVALNHCQNLVGQLDLMTVEICLLEVKSYQGQLHESYARLKSILTASNPLPETHQLWVTLMVTDMAIRLSDMKAAAEHLAVFPDFNNINYLVTWSDVKLALNQGHEVQVKLASLASSGLEIENSLVLRLAMAEHQLNAQTDTHKNHWQNVLALRMAQLQERNEKLHPNELSRYHLTLKPDPEKALHWAQINWQQAKEHQDRYLLEKAQAKVQEMMN